MYNKARDHGLSFRPHCKTHQSAEISSWFRDYPVEGITVSSFRMARYFASAGWKDILIAFPFHPGELDELKNLADSCKLSILLDTPAALPFLNQLSHPVDFYLDIDTGYGRTGIRSGNADLIQQILKKSDTNPRLTFKGFYCHAGHSYKASDRKEQDSIHLKALHDLGTLKEQFAEYGPRVLFGDTPNCSIQENFSGIDEITPGNFVFYDLVQHSLGACSPEDIAVALECPVAGKYHHRMQILVHGGGVHFSKEFLVKDGHSIYGRMVDSSAGSWLPGKADYWLNGLSQEHGILDADEDLFHRLNIGDKLLFLPVHSCLTANLAREYRTLDGQRIENIHSS